MRRQTSVSCSSNALWAMESEDYWKKHQKTNFRPRLLYLGGTFIIVSCLFLVIFIRKRSSYLDSLIIEALPSPQVREKCHSEAVQSSWHHSACQNLCNRFETSLPSPIMHQSCMDGCIYGTITIAKTTCSEVNEFINSSCNGENIDCNLVCSLYNNQMPRPTLTDLCKHSCLDILQASCTRANKILHRLHRQDIGMKEME